MITALKGSTILLVIEPGNIDNLEAGIPLSVELPSPVTKILLSYTPDIIWVKNEVQQGKELLDALKESMNRKPVHDRPYHKPETLKDIR